MVPLNMTWGERAVIALPEQDGDSKTLETAYPGIHRAIWTAAAPELKRQLEADLPQLWARLETLFVAELSEKEINGLLRFYRTPTGQRMIEGIYGNVDLTGAIASMSKSADGEMSEESISLASELAKRKTISGLDLDAADMRLLLATMPLDRLRATGAKVQKATSEWVNTEDPKDQEKINALMADAAERFVQEHESRK